MAVVNGSQLRIVFHLDYLEIKEDYLDPVHNSYLKIALIGIAVFAITLDKRMSRNNKVKSMSSRVPSGDKKWTDSVVDPFRACLNLVLGNGERAANETGNLIQIVEKDEKMCQPNIEFEDDVTVNHAVNEHKGNSDFEQERAREQGTTIITQDLLQEICRISSIDLGIFLDVVDTKFRKRQMQDLLELEEMKFRQDFSKRCTKLEEDRMRTSNEFAIMQGSIVEKLQRLIEECKNKKANPTVSAEIYDEMD